jgi:radical SAM superfamily enzyme YgiQ (UPF0313 family)
MKILLVYPESPNTFWSLKRALRFVSKKSSEPPLGLITVASLLPVTWEKRLIDMNVSRLKDKDISWADYVFISGMDIQKDSFTSVITRCNALGIKVVAGGPISTTNFREISGVDHFILNEAEITLPEFLEDLKKGTPKPIYSTDQFPELTSTPPPRWDLLEMKKYATMDIQYSRGCPFDCEFCSITTLYGRKPRTKGTEQFIREIESLYTAGWKGAVFIVDDNFIGNKKKLKTELLPALIEWSESRNYPFAFTTEVSINLSDDEELMRMMSRAGFRSTFVGIETPEEESLVECNKIQNRGRNLLDSVHTLQRNGFNVTGGFIVGFDNDTPDIFDRQIRFIQESGIATAMVGLLNAPIGTRLFKRLKEENRLTGEEFNGNNVDTALNFVPKMNKATLEEGYKRILKSIYSQKAYFERLKTFLSRYRYPSEVPFHLDLGSIKALFRAVWILGFIEKGKRFFWKLMFFVLRDSPKKLPQAVRLAIYGFHFRKLAQTI